VARSPSDVDQEYIHFVGSKTPPSLRCKLITDIIILSSRVLKYQTGIKNTIVLLQI